MTTCYINGKYKPLNQSYVSVTDRGFQFSDGVYEVIAVFKGELVDLNLHINRLFVSLKKMNIKIKFNRNQIINITNKIKKLNKLKMGIIYIQIQEGMKTQGNINTLINLSLILLFTQLIKTLNI